MFCTVCAAAIPSAAAACATCGAAVEASGGRNRAARSAPGGTTHPPARSAARLSARPLVLRLLYAVPALVLLVISGTLVARARLDQQEFADRYAAGAEAELRRDYPAAVDAFAAAGSYRDAPARRDRMLAMLAPYQAGYLDGVAALDRGEPERAIALLLPVARDVPSYRDAAARLADARGQRVAALWRELEAAESRRDWLGAERTLRQLQVADPGQPDLPARLRDLYRSHGPVVLGRDGGLRIAGVDGADERLLTDAVPVIWPAWSPDRSAIAFLSYDPDEPSGNVALYVIGADGSGLRRLADRISAHAPPAWSPDGKRIAYTSFAAFDPIRDTGHIGVRYVDVASGRETDLTGNRFDLAFNPSWSPTGDRIAFVAKRRSPGERPQLVPGDVRVATLGRPGSRNLTEGRVPDAWSVAWSPIDDRILVYSLYGQSWYEPPDTAIRLLDARTGDLRLVDGGDEPLGPPFWSPDGDRFAYTQGPSVLRIGDGDGGQALSADTDLSGDLTWSPDGGAIIALALDLAQPALLFELDGAGEPRSLPLDFDADRPFYAPPQWAPAAPAPPPQPPTLGGTGLDAAR